MIRYLPADALARYPLLSHSMFRDRAMQFQVRQGWPVTVDARGEERDEYDALSPLYVIWQTALGRHGGSMRFLPTTGRVMVNDIFGHLLGGRPLQSEEVWECTRFCLAPDAGPRVAAALMLAGGEILSGLGVRNFVGVFDRRMERIYRQIGASPQILGSDGDGRARISVGLWSFTPQSRLRVARRAGVSPALSRHWFRRAYGGPNPPARDRGGWRKP